MLDPTTAGGTLQCCLGINRNSLPNPVRFAGKMVSVPPENNVVAACCFLTSLIFDDWRDRYAIGSPGRQSHLTESNSFLFRVERGRTSPGENDWQGGEKRAGSHPGPDPADIRRRVFYASWLDGQAREMDVRAMTGTSVVFERLTPRGKVPTRAGGRRTTVLWGFHSPRDVIVSMIPSGLGESLSTLAPYELSLFP